MYLPEHMYAYALSECLVPRETEDAVGSPKTSYRQFVSHHVGDGS